MVASGQAEGGQEAVGLVVAFFMLEGLDEISRSLARDRVVDPVVVGIGSEGEATGVKHAAGERLDVGSDCYVEVAEHGVGLPTAEELDDVGVDAGT
jgi:hypothetical protein